MNHYRHHLGDYAKDTMHLSPLEHGVYRLLIDAYYATERPIPADIDSVCRIARAVSKVEREAVKRVLPAFFKESKDGWSHKRIDAEIATYQAKAEINRIVGKMGGRPSKRNPQETQTVCETIVNENPDETLASSHKPVTNSPSLRSGESRARKRARSPMPEGFGLSERVIDWAKGKGHGHLQEHLDAFRLKAVANDYRYVDWDAALMNAIEADWAGLRRNGRRDEPRGADAIEGAMRITAERDANAAH